MRKFRKAICEICNIEFCHTQKSQKFCSRKCGDIHHSKIMKGKKFTKEHRNKISNALKGSNNHFWNGGIAHESEGYILIHMPNHPFCNNSGYVRRSHLIMEKKLGRYLKPEEIVHHKGIKYPLVSIENKQDDRPENLRLFPNRSKHGKFHQSLSSLNSLRINTSL